MNEVSVDTPFLKESGVGAMAMLAGNLFHCTIVLGRKLCWMNSLVSEGTRKACG